MTEMQRRALLLALVLTSCRVGANLGAGVKVRLANELWLRLDYFPALSFAAVAQLSTTVKYRATAAFPTSNGFGSPCFRSSAACAL